MPKAMPSGSAPRRILRKPRCRWSKCCTRRRNCCGHNLGRDNGSPIASKPAPTKAVMKLALVRQKYTPFGGAERFMDRAVSALRASGTDVAVIAREWQGEQ